jgi:hypothetical protein
MFSPTVGQTTVGQTTVGQTTVGQTTVGQTTVGQTTVGQTTVAQTTVNQIQFCQLKCQNVFFSSHTIPSRAARKLRFTLQPPSKVKLGDRAESEVTCLGENSWVILLI